MAEYPVPLMGKIDDEFMSVPQEVLITSMRTNQKYFCMTDEAGKMAPRFIVVANMKAADGGKEIVAGNERVLRARPYAVDNIATGARNHNGDNRRAYATPNIARPIFHVRILVFVDEYHDYSKEPY